jgi:hypothetical protein
VEPVPEAGHHPEVAAPAADGPEEIRFVGRIDDADLPVGRDDLGRKERVDGQPVLAAEVADPAAERDAADADRARVAEAGRQAVLADGDRIGAGR